MTSDRPKKSHEKMPEWIANGVELGWLIDPFSRSATIYRAVRQSERRSQIDSIAGEGPLVGFVLELGRLWA